MSPRAAKALRWGTRAVLVIESIVVLGCVLQSAVWDHAFERFPPPGRLVDVGGHRLHVHCEGEGTPTVILESGGTHFSTEYRAIQRQLSQHARVCVYDRAGMGWSDPRVSELSTRELTDDLAAMLDNAAIAAPYLLVASSAGGLTVELFAREHPQDVVGIVLLDALASEMVARWPDRLDAMKREACLARSLNRMGLLRFLDPLERRAEGDLEVAFCYRDATWSAICSLVSSATSEAFRPAPPLRHDIPLVVISRDRPAEELEFEAEWRDGQEKSAARSSRGEVHVAYGSGHHVWADRPDLVVAAVLRLLAKGRR